jgi:hypothetical protein
MSYNEDNHTEDDCDKCKKRVGKEHLLKVPFLFLDCNDKKHPDMSYLYYPENYGYRQYYVCKECFELVKPQPTRGKKDEGHTI